MIDNIIYYTNLRWLLRIVGRPSLPLVLAGRILVDSGCGIGLHREVFFASWFLQTIWIIFIVRWVSKNVPLYGEWHLLGLVVYYVLCTSLNLTAIPDGRMTTSSGKDTIFRLALWFAISIGTGSFGGRTVPVFSSTISDNGGGGGGMRPLKIFLARYGMAAYDDSS